MNFEFASAGRIIFGPGSFAAVGALAAVLGSRVFVTTGTDPSRAGALLAQLEAKGLAHRAEPTHGEPSFDSIRGALARAREFRADLVIGFGGGAALDAAKAVAVLLANGGDPLDYAEVIGKGREFALPSLPVIAIPTTSGTGSEVTRNAVLSAKDEGVKVSLRSPTMLPRIALVDPELCLGLPPRVTADSGLDALTQLVEPFVSIRRNPLVDGLCREGLARLFRGLPKAYAAARRGDGSELEAREDMAFASLLGGLALANAGLGAVHGLAGPLGGLTGAPHGALCAALLPHVVKANLRALATRDPHNLVIQRYDEIASLVNGAAGQGGGAAGIRGDAAAGLSDFTAAFGTRRLRDLGLARGDFGLIAERALASSSMKANPLALEIPELLAILEAAW